MRDEYEVYEKFRVKNEHTRKMLLELQEFIQEANELEVYVSPNVIKNVIKKLKDVIGMLENKKLRVALVGGFSEGKTSIVAAWLGRYDKKTMKINIQESSDAIQIYDMDDKFEVIDTPGLFGYKEKVTDLGEIEKYKDITKKYISAAHIVIYVMDPTNPIKESHKEELVWLFRTLNLLPRTVFVINKVDEIADVEDDEDYNEKIAVKKETIIERLRSTIDLSIHEENSLPIVGISANPDGEGIEYWLEHRDEFERLSRIELLRNAITETIERKGGYFPIVYEMQKSIIRDVLIIHQDEFKEELDKFRLVVDGLKVSKDRMDKDLSKINEEIVFAKEGLSKFFISYFSELIDKIRACDPEDVQGFIDNEVGRNGCIIENKLQTEIEKRTAQVNERIKVAVGDFQALINQQESVFVLMGKDGAKFLLRNTFDNKKILFLRDGIVNFGKIVGADLGKMLKFKPWGATGFANKLNGALAAAGLLMEIWDLYKKREEEEKFNKALEDVADNFRDAQEQMLNHLKEDDFREKFFPVYVELNKNVSRLNDEICDMEKKVDKLNNWCEKGKKLAKKFYEMD